MTVREQYEEWLNFAAEDPALAEELASIAGDGEAIYDRFYADLEFGTAGLRGILGAGSRRMNIFTVRRATQALADCLFRGEEKRSAVIAYDSRINSERFARETAAVFAANGIKAYIFPELAPTPLLSYAVRELGCTAGVVITASHNPAQYNGYKAYGADGCQLSPTLAEEVFARMRQVGYGDGIRTLSFESGLESGAIEFVPDSLTGRYLDAVECCAVRPGICRGADLKVVYTPLNGAGNRCVREMLARIGVEKVAVVPEQEHPDGSFPTCQYPNPEDAKALQYGLALCRETGADLLLATDPDCDRLGTAVLHGGEYRLLSGNDAGVLMLDYILRSRTAAGTMPRGPVVVKTIVTTRLAEKIAAAYGAEVRNVLTGFRYIGEIIGELERSGEESRFLLGFEESYGYLSGAHVRDKDAVNAAMLFCEMAAESKLAGRTLIDDLERLRTRHGAVLDRVENYTFEGAEGMREMAAIMERLRENPPVSFAGQPVAAVTDYLHSRRTEDESITAVTLPKSNVLEFTLPCGGIIVRPSGTEPKLKVYYSVFGDGPCGPEALGAELGSAVKALIREEKKAE